MSGFVDIHQHVLYGMDDGPKTAKEMAAMLQAAVRDGITEIIATPHMRPGVVPFDEEAYRNKLSEAQQLCIASGWPLTLRAGVEMMYTPHATRYLRDRRVPTLAGSANVLVEFLPDVVEHRIAGAVEAIRRCGYYPILAHVERYPALLKKPDFARRLKAECDVSYQMNASTLVHRGAYFFRRHLQRFLDADLVDYIASDAHNTTSRPPMMQKAYAKLTADYGEEVAARLTGRNGIDFLAPRSHM